MTAPVASNTGTTTWTVDPAHSNVEFAVKHLMISTVRGRFGEVKGTVVVNEQNPSASRVDIEIGTASIDTRAEQRDAHLRSPDFFDVEKFPSMRFRSKKIEGDINGDFTVIGDLTIRDITNEVKLDVTFEGRNKDPWGGERMGFTASGKINREEFGLKWNQALETGGWLVGPDVKLIIEAQLVRQQTAATA